MKGITSKITFVKNVLDLLVLVALFVSVLSGCGKQYKDTFKNNPEAAAMMEEAIESLQLCLDGKIGVDRIGDELKAIADKYETKIGNDGMADVYRTSISMDGSFLSFYAVEWELGIESTASMMERVEETKAELEDSLYK